MWPLNRKDGPSADPFQEAIRLGRSSAVPITSTARPIRSIRSRNTRETASSSPVTLGTRRISERKSTISCPCRSMYASISAFPIFTGIPLARPAAGASSLYRIRLPSPGPDSFAGTLSQAAAPPSAHTAPPGRSDPGSPRTRWHCRPSPARPRGRRPPSACHCA